ncbi:unnamed protein product [Parajaminaea phylloscopi]
MADRLFYGRDDARQFVDLYTPLDAASVPPLVIFIHGGAWRTGSPEDHSQLGASLTQHGVAVAVVGYRLSLKAEDESAPEGSSGYTNPHPTHIEDVFAALRLLLVDGARREQCPYDTQRAILVGHSVGAWMASAVFLNSEGQQVPDHASRPIPALGRNGHETQLIRSSIVACVLLDGIYDLTSLLEEYPSYSGFVGQAIPDLHQRRGMELASATSWPLPHGSGDSGRCPHVYIAHSADDELLTFRQSVEMASHICDLLGAAGVVAPEQVKEDSIPAASVGVAGYTSSVGVKSCPPSLVVDLTSLKGTHDGMLQRDDFFRWMLDLVRTDSHAATQ